MKVVHELDKLGSRAGRIAMAIGFFDGVHRGHQKLIRETIRDARHHGGGAWAMTFEPHPSAILQPDVAPGLLTPLPQKLAALEHYGLDGCLVYPFTRETAQTEAEAFVDHLLGRATAIRQIFVGQGWRFGHRRQGTVRLLGQLARQRDVAVTSVRPVLRGNAAVSSTRVREAIRTGNMREAHAMLGRPYGVTGTVVGGERIARALGYPTANIQIDNALLPPCGIYAARCYLGKRSYEGIVSYGFRPTFKALPASGPVFELHVFDFNNDLYGKTLTIELLQHIRDELTFDSAAELRDQIAADVAQVRQLQRTPAGAAKKSERMPLHTRGSRL